MKQIVSMSRLTNQLEKMFRLLNQDFFNNELETPIITVVPSSRSYAHYTPWSAWQSKDTYRREINIASGTLDRPLEAVTASLLHEMVHMYNDLILNIQDCSRGGHTTPRYSRNRRKPMACSASVLKNTGGAEQPPQICFWNGCCSMMNSGKSKCAV